MWRMYQNKQEDETLKVRQCFFRNIFNTNYNIGFKTPRQDVCSRSSELTDEIKKLQNEEKVLLMASFRIHKLMFVDPNVFIPFCGKMMNTHFQYRSTAKKSSFAKNC